MEIPGKMQAALVSYYGNKTGMLEELIRYCQDKLSSLMLSAFRPYEPEQVHGTIIGLEGYRCGDKIVNANYRLLRNESKLFCPEEILNFIRSEQFPRFNIRFGGYRQHLDYGILSQNRHPYLRSFSIQGEIAVAMGWPDTVDSMANNLDNLRYRFNNYNILHKWHRNHGDIDNDYYFVLGRVNRRRLSKIQIQFIEEEMRSLLSGIQPLIIPIEPSVLSIIGYLDTQAATQTSCSYNVLDPGLNAKKLLSLYPEAEFND